MSPQKHTFGIKVITMKLLRSQKNTFFDILNESNSFSPAQFRIEDSISHNTPTHVFFSNSGYYFSMEHSGNPTFPILVKFSPAKDSYLGKDVFSDFLYIGDVFKEWLGYLAREISIEDKWLRFANEVEQINISESSENDKFSASEFDKLQSQMLSLKERIRKIDLTPQQLLTIENKIDHITDLAKNLNKFDWKSLFAGTIVSIIVQLGVTQENAKAIWDSIRSVFNTYFLP
jgi:hypothetical protein